MVDLVFLVPPVAKERARVTRFGAYTPARTKEFQNQIVRILIKDFDKPIFDCPLKVSLEFHLPKPVRGKFDVPAVRPDLDNYVKAILDACNGRVWSDDALICKLDTEKIYAENQPFIKMRVEKYVNSRFNR